jgi:hypothetical protein
MAEETSKVTHIEMDPQFIYSLRIDSLARQVAQVKQEEKCISSGYRAMQKARLEAAQTIAILASHMGIKELGGYLWTDEGLQHPGLITRLKKDGETDTDSE